MVGGARLKEFLPKLATAAVPMVAGAAVAIGAGDAPVSPTAFVVLAAKLLGLGVIFAIIGRAIPDLARNTLVRSTFAGLLPVLLGFAVLAGPAAALRDPALLALAVTFAVYVANPALVARPSASSPGMFRLLNTLPIAALALPVIIGRIHWGIIILPFAVFRIAVTTADKVRPGEEYEISRREAAEVAEKIFWIGGVWVAGWAGVTP